MLKQIGKTYGQALLYSWFLGFFDTFWEGGRLIASFRCPSSLKKQEQHRSSRKNRVWVECVGSGGREELMFMLRQQQNVWCTGCRSSKRQLSQLSERERVSNMCLLSTHNVQRMTRWQDVGGCQVFQLLKLENSDKIYIGKNIKWLEFLDYV